MKIKINGVELKEKAVSTVAVPVAYDIDGRIRDITKMAGDCVLPISIVAGLANVLKEQLFQNVAGAAPYVAGTSIPVIAGQTTSFNLATALAPLIGIAQQFAFPVALIVATWGLIDYMLGNADGKTKIKSSLIGYIGVYVIPFIFNAIQKAFGGI